MPRTQTIRRTVYTFNELSQSAKDRACQDYHENGMNYDWYDAVYDDFQTIAALLGYTIKERAARTVVGKVYTEPCIMFSGFWSQGDGACFEGTWRADDVKPRKLRSHAGTDKELHRIARELGDIARTYPRATATLKHTDSYYHEYSVSVDVDLGAVEVVPGEVYQLECSETAKEIVELSRDLMRWLYKTLESEHEYLTSPEHIADESDANGWEYDENGRLV